MNELNGLWGSKYCYSGGESSHQLQFEENEGYISATSLPNDEGSSLQLSLSRDGGVLTGTWHETTAHEGIYTGAEFHGALQLILDVEGTKAEGRWVGFNKDRSRVNEGYWVLQKIL